MQNRKAVRGNLSREEKEWAMKMKKEEWRELHKRKTKWVKKDLIKGAKWA